MNVYITKINGQPLKNTAQYIQHMTTDIGHQLGCREMGIYRYNANAESVESRNSRFDGIIAGIGRGDIIICQFPTGNGLKFEMALVNHIKAYHGRIAIFIHELEALSHKSKCSELQETVRVYNQAEVIIVPTYAMQNYLRDNGIRNDMKFVVQEMWDYIADEYFFHYPSFQKEICFADSEGFAGMNEWKYSVPLKLYNISAGQGLNVHNMGEREPRQLFSELSKGGFGLVWYKDEDSYQYMEYSASFSIARYLAAGIPVIVPSGISSSVMIKENRLGWVVQSLEEAIAVVENMTESEYQEYVQCVVEFGVALKRGYYTKKCLIEAIQSFYRKDAGRISTPEKAYYSEECTISSTILKESYRGNLALSWCCKGKPDGFLICDESRGKVLCDTKNVYQHYFLLKDCEIENGFVVKAYLDTLKGKLIIAESEQTYLQTEQYEIPKVSLIIPAYNAEDYIVRSVDTALAQLLSGLEIIIVDDGSTDHTPEILDWYAEKYENVKVIHQENAGVAAARNTGIKFARGEYIGFMDNDDMLRPDMITRLYNAAKVNDCDIALTSVFQIGNNGYEVFLEYPMEENVAIKVDEFIGRYCANGFGHGIVIWNKLYRASLIKERLFPILPHDDEAWTPYIMSFAEKICYLNDYSYEYDRVIRKETLVDKWFGLSKEKLFANLRKTTMFYLENGNPKKADMLKHLAMGHLLFLSKAYAYDAYEKLWQEIEQKLPDLMSYK